MEGYELISSKLSQEQVILRMIRDNKDKKGN